MKTRMPGSLTLHPIAGVYGDGSQQAVPLRQARPHKRTWNEPCEAAMKLYYATGTCSFASHIVAREADIPLELEKVDIFKTPHMTASGQNFNQINPKGYVPALLLGDGSLLTEGAAIVQ